MQLFTCIVDSVILQIFDSSQALILVFFLLFFFLLPNSRVSLSCRFSEKVVLKIGSVYRIPAVAQYHSRLAISHGGMSVDRFFYIQPRLQHMIVLLLPLVFLAEKDKMQLKLFCRCIHESSDDSSNCDIVQNEEVAWSRCLNQQMHCLFLVFY